MPLAAQQVRGTILEADSGAPMHDALVSVLAGSDSVAAQIRTDSVGRFSVALQRAGVYSLRVERLGYRTVSTESLAIADAEVLEVRIVIGIEAVRLTPLEVTARYHDSRAHPDFHRRVEWGRQTGAGVFFTRDEIEQGSYVRTSSMLMQAPSIRLRYGRDGSVYLGASERGTYNCRSAVFVNGVEFDQASGLDEFSPHELEGVEVYRWRSEIPSEFARAGVCAVVAFWMRAGRPGGGRSWRALAGAALLGIAMFVLVR